MIYNKNDGRFLAGGAAIFALYEWVDNPLASWLTHSPSPTHWPIG